MNLDEQRKFASGLAQEAGASKTLSAIQDKNSCFEDIFRTAVAEVGVQKLVEYLLRGDPNWAYQALRYVPDLGSNREMLIKKTAETPESAVHALRFIDDLGGYDQLLRTAAAPLDQAPGITSLELHAEDTRYAAYFLMHWVNNGKALSYETYVSQWIKDSCGYFAGGPSVGPPRTGDGNRAPALPITPGDQLWISVHAQSGDTVESPLRFTWTGAPGDPPGHSFLVGKFVASGTVKSVHLDYGGIF
jgi:hypothetical protein